MLVYGEYECFIMHMLYVCVLCASCGSSQCCVLHDFQMTQPTSGGAVTADSSCCANYVEPSRPHQWGPDLPSVLSPLLFPIVMDVVSSEARSGLPSELLYADDLVLMTPKM